MTVHFGSKDYPLSSWTVHFGSTDRPVWLKTVHVWIDRPLSRDRPPDQTRQNRLLSFHTYPPVLNWTIEKNENDSSAQSNNSKDKKNGGFKEDFKGTIGGTLRVLLKVLPTAKFPKQSGQNTKSGSIFRGHSFYSYQVAYNGLRLVDPIFMSDSMGGDYIIIKT